MCVITNISLDHTAFLGDTIEQIALEKAGIIKKDTTVIIGRKQSETTTVFEEKAKVENAPLFYASSFNHFSDLKGNYQDENINTCISSIRKLQEKGWSISEEHIQNGLKKVVANTGILGRWQTIHHNPLTICDTGHNEDGIQNILKQLRQTPHEQLHIVWGTVNDKNIEKLLALLPINAIYYFCEANIPRAMPKEKLLTFAKQYKLKGQYYSSVKAALSSAYNNANIKDLIFIGGSTFVVAEVL